MDRVEAHRAIATLHSFRFFGLVFIVPGVVGPNLPAGFATFAAYGDFATGVLAIAGAPHGKDTSAVLAVRRCLQCRGATRLPARLLSRHPGRTSRHGGGIRRRLRDPDPLRAAADDHARRSTLLAGALAGSAGASCGEESRQTCYSRRARSGGKIAPSTIERRARHEDANYCVAARVEGGARAASRQGEGTDPRPGRVGRRAAADAVGRRGKGIYV